MYLCAHHYNFLCIIRGDIKKSMKDTQFKLNSLGWGGGGAKLLQNVFIQHRFYIYIMVNHFFPKLSLEWGTMWIKFCFYHTLNFSCRPYMISRFNILIRRNCVLV